MFPTSRSSSSLALESLRWERRHQNQAALYQNSRTYQKSWPIGFSRETEAYPIPAISANWLVACLGCNESPGPDAAVKVPGISPAPLRHWAMCPSRTLRYLLSIRGTCASKTLRTLSSRTKWRIEYWNPSHRRHRLVKRSLRNSRVLPRGIPPRPACSRLLPRPPRLSGRKRQQPRTVDARRWR
jgi:hypothetical protein